MSLLEISCCGGGWDEQVNFLLIKKPIIYYNIKKKMFTNILKKIMTSKKIDMIFKLYGAINDNLEYMCNRQMCLVKSCSFFTQ